MYEAVISDKLLWARAEKGTELSVDGVFSNGIYFIFQDGSLLMLHDSLYGSLAFGAAVKNFAGQGRSFGIKPGMRAYLSADRLSITDADVCFPICFSPHALPSGRIAACFLQNAVRRAVMPEDLFSHTAAPALDKLFRGLQTEDAALLQDAAQGLIGLGTGLTPTYDDYLTGLLFCLHYAELNVEALDRAVLDSLGRTNQYSAAFLRAAAEGGNFSLLADCLETGGEEALNRLLTVGSSSGHDMLAGMCAAMTFLESNKLAL